MFSNHSCRPGLVTQSTSSICYQSYYNAAAELLCHLPLYIEFLELVRDKKDSMMWTNMELNLYNALHNPATLSELAILASYGEVISIPCLRRVRRDPTENGLTFGPYYQHVKDHCKKIISNSDVFLGVDASYTTANLDTHK